ncbi:MAG: hypothetical protein ACTJHZ_09445 [Vagococcus sp.]
MNKNKDSNVFRYRIGNEGNKLGIQYDYNQHIAQDRVGFLESKYDNLLLEAEELKKMLVSELSNEKELLVKELSHSKIEEEFNHQHFLNYDKMVTNLETHNQKLEKQLINQSNSLIQLKKSIKLQHDYIKDIKYRIERLNRLITIDEKRLASTSSYSKAIESLIITISKRQRKLEELHYLLKFEDKKLYLLETKIKFELAFSKKEQEILRNSQLENNELITKCREKRDSFDSKYNEIYKKRDVLLQNQKHTNQKIEQLSLEFDVLESDLAKEEVYLVITDDLPKGLSDEEASSMRIWNNLFNENQNISIATTQLNTNLPGTIKEYKRKGWLPQHVSVYNLYNDLLVLDEKTIHTTALSLSNRRQMLEDFYVMEKNNTKYYYDSVEDITLLNYQNDDLDCYNFIDGLVKYIEIYDQDRLLMDGKISNDQIEYQRYYDNLGKAVLSFRYKDARLQLITYKNNCFYSEQEFLVYWLTNVVEPNAILNIIVDQYSMLLGYIDMLSEKGINLVPLIQDEEHLKEVRDLLKLNNFNEIFVTDSYLLNQISDDIPKNCIVHVLESNHENDESRISIMIDR